MYLNHHRAHVMRLTRWARSLQNAIACPYDRLILSGKPTNLIWRFFFQKAIAPVLAGLPANPDIWTLHTFLSLRRFVASWLQAASCVQSKFQEANHA
jgi:hypothetical protein